MPDERSIGYCVGRPTWLAAIKVVKVASYSAHDIVLDVRQLRRDAPRSIAMLASPQVFRLELCADDLVVGGGVWWSYDKRRRLAA